MPQDTAILFLEVIYKNVHRTVCNRRNKGNDTMFISSRLNKLYMMEYHTVKMIQLQIYTTTQNLKNGQISSIFKGINCKGKIHLIIRTVVTLRGGAHRASEITVISLNWVLRTLVFTVLFTLQIL